MRIFIIEESRAAALPAIDCWRISPVFGGSVRQGAHFSRLYKFCQVRKPIFIKIFLQHSVLLCGHNAGKVHILDENIL